MESQTLALELALFSLSVSPNHPHDLLASSALQMDTLLQFCTLVSMSSFIKQPTFRSSNFRFGSNIEQKVIGCAISNSTNHQSGTAMMDPNLGLFGLPQHFVLVLRPPLHPNEEKSESFKDHEQGDRFSVEHSLTYTSVSFTLCTFCEMTADNETSLTVTQCFFHKCSLDSTIRGGGAVLVVASSTQPEPLTIKSSSFTECSTSSSSENKPTGGAVAGVVCTQITMENCFFETCSAHQGGGLVSDRSPTTISNCVLWRASRTTLFRECQSTSITNSSDIRFSNISNETVSNSIMFAIQPLARQMFPQVEPDQQTSVSSMEISIGQGKATITIRTTSEVNGTMSAVGRIECASSHPHRVWDALQLIESRNSRSVDRNIWCPPVLADGKKYTLQSAAISGFSLVVDTHCVRASLEWIDATCLYLLLKVSGDQLPSDSLSNFAV
ncbi:hypothetical protein BLNAU_23800 [Blattamonas nauphoetae]|uniref:Uncharacterized protein n=1 Tax=Blattamonas nauphoetae TaxID=2049346 RepID=A0ABQ9WRA3_9EUKA|nr:hypothetical protein BLNAU_23800 [Blattamonas nauphoetae]